MQIKNQLISDYVHIYLAAKRSIFSALKVYQILPDLFLVLLNPLDSRNSI